MGYLDGGQQLLWAQQPLGPPRPKVGSAPLRVRQAARPASTTEEGLPSTGRTPVV